MSAFSLVYSFLIVHVLVSGVVSLDLFPSVTCVVCDVVVLTVYTYVYFIV